VEQEQGQLLANKHGISFYETSARDNVNVHEAMMDVTSKIVRKMIREGTLERRCLQEDTSVKLTDTKEKEMCCL